MKNRCLENVECSDREAVFAEKSFLNSIFSSRVSIQMRFVEKSRLIQLLLQCAGSFVYYLNY